MAGLASSVYSIMATDPRDWSVNPVDAWLYGIFVGWPDAALKEVATKHKWSGETLARLQNLNAEFKRRSK